MDEPSHILKFRRAYEHLNNAKTAVEQFIGDKPYRITEEENPEPLQRTWSIILTKSIPVAIPLIAGDCVHNFRSVLDHWVFEFSRTKKGKPGKGTGFPIVPEKKNWNPPAPRKGGFDRISRLPQKTQTLIESWQPYHTGIEERYTRDRLAALHELDIGDKHLTLNLAASAVDFPILHLPDGASSPKIMYFFEGPLQPNTPETLLVVEFESVEDSKVDVKVDSAMEVILIQDQAWSGPGTMPLISTLESFVHCISWVVGNLNWSVGLPAQGPGPTPISPP